MSFAQDKVNISSITGLKYYSDKGDFIAFISDSIMTTSYNSYGDTATFYVLGDTLFAEQNYSSTYGENGKGWHRETAKYYYVFTNVNYDSLTILSHGYYGRNNRQETEAIKLYNNKSLIEKIDNFEYFSVETKGPWHGYEKLKISADLYFELTIDSNGVVKFDENGLRKFQVENYKFKITKKELERGLELLKHAQISKLKRANQNVMDKTTISFILKSNGNRKVYYDCEINEAQVPLIKYMRELRIKYYKPNKKK
ncbi:MAG: hypothetical protein RL660_2341 [Bacteroidota bacterium]|jgi:hypothetical protein